MSSSSAQLNTGASGSKISSSSGNNPEVSQLDEQLQSAKDESLSDSSNLSHSNIHISPSQNDDDDAPSLPSSIPGPKQQNEISLSTEQEPLNAEISNHPDNAADSGPKSSPNKESCKVQKDVDSTNNILLEKSSSGATAEAAEAQTQKKVNFPMNAKALSRFLFFPFLFLLIINFALWGRKNNFESI